MKKILIVFSIIASLCSCQKDVDLKVPEQPSLLAVNAVWQENQVLTVAVSRTLNIKDKPRWNEQEAYYVTNADVKVFKDNMLYDQLTYNAQEHKYISSSGKLAVPGSTYSVKVVAPGFTEATTTPVGFLEKVPITSLTFRKNVGKDDYGQMVDEIKIEFNDPPQVKNFYLMKIQRDQFQSEQSVFPLTKDVVVPLGEDPLETMSRVPANRIIFTDQAFDGQHSKSMVIRVPSYYLRDWQDPDNVIGTISLFNVSEDVFLYNRSRILDTENPFAEPVQIHTNIFNGVGVFGLLSGEAKELQ
jgi:hypothetical protein